MAHFKLIPVDSLLDFVEFHAVSAASVLDIALRMQFGETDVYCDGPYKCTISHGDNGVWTIAQRKEALGYGDKRDRRMIGSEPADLRMPFTPQPEMARG